MKWGYLITAFTALWCAPMITRADYTYPTISESAYGEKGNVVFSQKVDEAGNGLGEMETLIGVEFYGIPIDRQPGKRWVWFRAKGEVGVVDSFDDVTTASLKITPLEINVYDYREVRSSGITWEIGEMELYRDVALGQNKGFRLWAIGINGTSDVKPVEGAFGGFAFNFLGANLLDFVNSKGESAESLAVRMFNGNFRIGYQFRVNNKALLRWNILNAEGEIGFPVWMADREKGGSVAEANVWSGLALVLEKSSHRLSFFGKTGWKGFWYLEDRLKDPNIADEYRGVTYRNSDMYVLFGVEGTFFGQDKYGRKRK